MPDAADRPTVLLVDDDYLVRDCTAELLAAMRCTVIQATNGLDALSLVGQHTAIRLLFTDCRMPDMDGPTLAAITARLRPELPIVLATGYHDELPTRWPILRKPYHFAEVEALLRRLLPDLGAAAA